MGLDDCSSYELVDGKIMISRDGAICQRDRDSFGR